MMKTSEQNEYGTVWLVGAGPGDPELLTLKAMRVINEADAVLYDSLISEEILDMLPRQCTRIHVGKRCGDHKMGQADIQSLLYATAKKHKTVVRLKGGDPFIFGRGGEELEYLQQRGIEVNIVPGITAAGGCAAAAKIPLTHRHKGNALLLQSGHSQYGDFEVSQAPTQVFYMGVKQAGGISARLLNDGLSPSTPVAIIANGTLKNQRVLKGKLIELPALAQQHLNHGPALIIVGDVAEFAQPDAQQHIANKTYKNSSSEPHTSSTQSVA